jgi:hypothetical protein
MKVNINAKSVNQMVNAETVNIDQRSGESESPPSNEVASGGIFISYRRKDSADVVGRIYDQLVKYFGAQYVFKDVYSIPLGSDFGKYIIEAIGKSGALLAVIGEKWLEMNDAGKTRLDELNDFVRIEIESALAGEIPVIPLLVRGAAMPSKEKLPPSLEKLSGKNGIQIRSDPDFHIDMKRLITSLEKYIIPH